MQQHQGPGQARHQHHDPVGQGDRHALGRRQAGQPPDQGRGSLAHAPAGDRERDQHRQQHRRHQRQQGGQRQTDADRPGGTHEHQGIARHHQQRPAELLRPHRGGQQAALDVAAEAHQRRRRAPDEPPAQRHQQQYGACRDRQRPRGDHPGGGARQQFMPERRGGQHRDAQQRHGQLAGGALDDHRPPGTAATSAGAGVTPGPGGIPRDPARQHLVEEQRQGVLGQRPAQAQGEPQQAGGEAPTPGAERQRRQGQGEGEQGPARGEPLHLGEQRRRLEPGDEPEEQRHPRQRPQQATRHATQAGHPQAPPVGSGGRASRSR